MNFAIRIESAGRCKAIRLAAAAIVSVVALGPAASLAFAEKPRGGPPDRAEASRFARGDPGHYAPPVFRPARDRPPQHTHYTDYDTRWDHRHYYPPRGYYYPYAPRNAVIVHHHHHRYYYGGGIWYAPSGLGWAVVTPPLGIFVSLLPPYYSTVWFGGIPYYYANDVYYRYCERERAYEVVEPPYRVR